MSTHRGRFQAQGGGVEESEPWAEQAARFVDRAAAHGGHGRISKSWPQPPLPGVCASTWKFGPESRSCPIPTKRR